MTKGEKKMSETKERAKFDMQMLFSDISKCGFPKDIEKDEGAVNFYYLAKQCIDLFCEDTYRTMKMDKKLYMLVSDICNMFETENDEYTPEDILKRRGIDICEMFEKAVNENSRSECELEDILKYYKDMAQETIMPSKVVYMKTLYEKLKK